MSAFIDRIQPAPVNGGFRMDEQWVWCGSAIRGDDGRYHMFASMWSKSGPFNWVTKSRIVRAVSDTPEGPYHYADEVLPPRGPDYWDGMMTHNPTIHRHGDTFLLFYTGTTYPGEPPLAGKATEPQRMEARQNQRIGLAYAPSPEGPWTRLCRPILEVRPDSWDCLLTTNAAPVVHEDGSVLLLYKSAAGHAVKLQYGVAKADHWLGPYQRQIDDPLIFKGDPSVCYEDAFVWREHDMYQMIFKDMNGDLCGERGGGVHALSPDGLAWDLAPNPHAYSKTVLYADGSTQYHGSLERPQLLIQDGKPTHLFNAASCDENHFWETSATFSLCRPLS